MAVTFDVKKTSKLLEAYNRRLNITITLFDSELKCICSAGEWQQYCLAIGEYPELLAKCEGCNRDNAHKALEQNGTLVYTCHAGIIEVVTPIFCDGVIVAYLMLGKFRDAEKQYTSESIICEKAEKYGLDKAKMLKAYSKLPVFDKSYIDDAILFLDTCTCYMVYMKEVIQDRHPIRFKRIMEYIDKHLCEKITADDLCREFHVTRHTLYDIFEKNDHTTVQDFIATQRLKKAINLLVTTEKSVREIAVESGFGDYNYFIQFFKKRMGMPPMKYRRKNSNSAI